MKLLYGQSNSGNLKEAIREISNPKLLIMFSNEKQFESHVKELEELFPNVNSIGCVGMSYNKNVVENGVGLVALCDVEVVTNVLEQVSVVPVKDIKNFEKDFNGMRPTSKDTVIFDLCTGNDACVLTMLNSITSSKGVSIVGGTTSSAQVSCNGKIYNDSAVYAIVKTPGKNIKVYKENIYKPMEEYRFVASNTKKDEYYVGKFNKKSSKKEYMDAFNLKENEVANNTFKNPLGKIIGDDIYIVSIKDVKGEGLTCYRQINESDVLTILELGDYKQIVKDTVTEIKNDFNSISGVISVNCIFRYLLFKDENYMDDYLREMGSLGGKHVGFIGNGEHYKDIFINQSMSCIVFE